MAECFLELMKYRNTQTQEARIPGSDKYNKVHNQIHLAETANHL